MLDGVSFALAVIAAADLCLKYGKILSAKCEAYKHAHVEIAEALLRIQYTWDKVETQLDVLRNIANGLGERLQVHHNQMLQRLQGKLQAATTMVDSFFGEKEGRAYIITIPRRLRYAIYAKSSLGRIVEDLDRWHREWDPSWIMIARIATPAIDKEITAQKAAKNQSVSIVKGLRDAHRINSQMSEPLTTIFLPREVLVQGDASQIRFSSAGISLNVEKATPVIVDRVSYHPESGLARATKDVRDLARVLSQVDPVTCSLLTCQGVIKIFDTSGSVSAFDFLFSVPSSSSSTIRSLRDHLLYSTHSHPLDERFELARLMARSIIFLHNAGFVHKNISPENVLVMEQADTVLGKPFLVGFEKFRLADGQTYRSGDVLWEKNIYRHPKRQGPQPEEDYVMQHDIYSLGVCLLEIGLWTSFVTYDSQMKDPTPGSGLDIMAQLSLKDQRKKAFEIERILVEMAKERLPSHMGKKYTDVVISCLTCLDKSNSFGKEDEFMDEDGVEVGVRYIEKILQAIDGISV